MRKATLYVLAILWNSAFFDQQGKEALLFRKNFSKKDCFRVITGFIPIYFPLWVSISTDNIIAEYDTQGTIVGYSTIDWRLSVQITKS